MRMKELIKIQKELKAPKNQMNNFGGYKYRSCEDILEAVKPLLNGAMLTITDEMIQLGDRYYVKATATLTASDKSISVSAYAREALDKKGMDSAQITGAASSYARKYCLNGLFLIDDTKDADTMDNTEKVQNNPPAAPNNAVPEKPDIPETDEMKARAAEILDDFESSKDLMELTEKYNNYRDEVNSKMSQGYKDWLRNGYNSVKTLLTKEVK